MTWQTDTARDTVRKAQAALPTLTICECIVLLFDAKQITLTDSKVLLREAQDNDPRYA